MATGDAAAAKGLRVVPATKDLRLGYDDINQRGDELAAEMDARAAADTTLTNNKLDKAKVLVQSAPMAAGTAVGTLRFW